MSTIGSTQLNGAASSPEVSAIGSRPASIRHSMDGAMKFFQDTSSSSASDTTPSSIVSPPTNHILATPPKLQQSYSANDVPTVKSANGTPGLSTNANNHAQQHFHNHNASLGRIPAGVMPNRHSRELSVESGMSSNRENSAYPSIGSTLQASAAPFGPAPVLAQSSAPAVSALTAQAAGNPYPYYAGAPYGVPNGNPAAYGNLPMLMQSLSVGGANPALYPPQGYTGYSAIYHPSPRPQPQDSQARVIQNRRQIENEGKSVCRTGHGCRYADGFRTAMARYNNLPLESVGGTIYSLCKDQHGCRYLQKQLENRVPDQIHMIWLETNQHVVELMTDPFGNYLCQKLLEYCSDDERTVLIQNASEAMVRIALNQHGTRALQKMIEHVTTPVQVKLIIDALRYQVVELIQDLNGNHVIQKCLNKLSAVDAQFIFEAVGTHCVEVGTHRHGCCVLQRCIDHADGVQKVWLIECITKNAVTLVQDPFGNYVVQYIIDLDQEAFTEPVVRQFHGRITSLSRHKFSSNVIEKCLRCASDTSKDMIVEELLSPGEMANLLRDNFANYVIQTALEYATTHMKNRLVDCIRPVLPSIRATPYGRRIQAKIQAFDTRNGQREPAAPTLSPISDNTGNQINLRPAHQRMLPIPPSILPPATNYTNGTGANGVGINGVNVGGTNGSSVNGNGTNSNGTSGVSGVGLGGYPQAGAMSIAQPSQAPPQPPRAQQFPPQFPVMGAPAENGETQWF